ncbi:putative utp25, U3 small nucleolar RNA-associated SSU processome protein 25 [Lyophyllum shimeji]|uniref:U3 small nucleolar RNA-associated protein 25 n=1 Tax=Lyophyllum shimeji TaxID=47721 RepID=A0A9P3UKU2_LYOSH|nr:putative utp25, U3 small nucleolar RNA-associated SSU processome protein 25 [Lyophyllum shimeji]
MAINSDTSITTSLLTLLNVSATKAGKRKLTEAEFVPAEKLNKRKSARFSELEPVIPEDGDTPGETKDVGEDPALEDGPDDADVGDGYESHFGSKPTVLTEPSRNSVDSRAWKLSKERRGKLGNTVLSTPESSQAPDPNETPRIDILERLRTPFQSRQSKQSPEQTELQNDLLSTLSSRRDLYLTSTPLESRKCMREAIALHAVNHITKKRRRVLKNNERLAHATKADPNAEPPEDVQDQGFTRPSVLFLLPFRSAALDWYHALISHTPPPTFQIENQNRFTSEYGLPPRAIDKLAEAEPGTYPRDHVETFKGNVDDNFRVGIKLTRKSVKMFAEFYGCDVIMASPLGLRRSIEKEKNADYLSSIEILVVDQLDALTMQNWDHVQLVLSHMNKLPKESHDTDFSRIKPWYLDGHAAYLRQSILLAAYETPEGRALYNTSLRNVAGKYRTQRHWSPIEVPEGIEQNFIYFDCANPKDEADKRFHHFTTQLLPTVLKSAVQSANTVVFIPSSFDFIRVQNYFRKHGGVTFTILSEYSTNQDISRARQAFFQGKKCFLLISERFHFYKRYKIRGIRNLIFYGPPDHPQFYTEFLSYPFLDDGVESSDVTCRVLYSKYDWFRLERIAGTEAAAGLIKAS